MSDSTDFDPMGGLPEIGIVLGGARPTHAPIQIRKDMEKLVEEQQAVLIEDSTAENSYYLGILRMLKLDDPLLRSSIRSPYVEHHEYWREAYPELSYMNAMVSICAILDFENRRVRISRRPPSPGARVLLLIKNDATRDLIEEIEKLLASLTEMPIFLGEHAQSGIRIPLEASRINCHAGVFGATGTGKSKLVCALSEELSRAGFRLIIFDHTGVDYAQHFSNIVSSREIKLSKRLLVNLIVDAIGESNDYLEISILDVLENLEKIGERSGAGAQITLETFGVDSGEIEDISREESLGRIFRDELIKNLDRCKEDYGARKSVVDRIKKKIDTFLDESLLDNIFSRKIEPDEIVRRALSSEEPLVIDMSYDTDISIKRGIMSSVIEAAWRICLERREQLNLGFVIDEAQNYANSSPTKEWIEKTAREGRKWNLFVILASQRIAVDISPSIRSNLGTYIFSRLQASTDLGEIGKYMDLSGIDETDLSILDTREFFVAGLMNPLRIPMLLRVREVPNP